MRIRSTRPEFWRSKRVASVDWETRLVLKALESYVDDNGVGKYDIELIVTDTFARDALSEPSRTLMRVKTSIEALREAGLLWKYTVDGQELIFIAFWDSTQHINRPTKGRFRRPDGTLNYKDSVIGAPEDLDSVSPHEDSRGLSAGAVEQWSSGAVEQTSSATDDEHAFDEFWKLYPRKTGKGAAEKAWVVAIKKTDPEVILTALREQLPSLQMQRRTDGDFRPHPATWLNQKRWEDESVELLQAASGSSSRLRAYQEPTDDI